MRGIEPAQMRRDKLEENLFQEKYDMEYDTSFEMKAMIIEEKYVGRWMNNKKIIKKIEKEKKGHICVGGSKPEDLLFFHL